MSRAGELAGQRDAVAVDATRLADIEDRISELESRVDRAERERDRNAAVAHAAIAHARYLWEELESVEAREEARSKWLDQLKEHLYGMPVVDDAYDDVLAETPLVEAVVTDAEAAASGPLNRSKLLPIHRMWVDLQSGDADALPSKSARRGARLFGRFVKKGRGEPDQGVDATYGTYSMDQPTAREKLESDGDPVDASSKQAERAMKAVQRFSKVEDCDCESIRACDHGLLVWETSNGTNKLVANADEFDAAMENAYASAGPGLSDIGVSPTDDDATQREASEAGDGPSETTAIRETADEKLRQLDQARKESSDTVVRTSGGGSSDQPNHRD